MPTAHVVLIDGLADWEPGHLLTELSTGRFLDGDAWSVHGVGLTTEPITTMGAMRWQPELTLDEVDPADSDLLVMPGGTGWTPGREEPFVELAARFRRAGTPVAAICGATEALARAGFLDNVPHTSSAAEVLAATGYGGAAHYVEARAVAADGLITAGPQSPVQFAVATLGLLGLMAPGKLDAYEAVFHAGDPAGYAALMAS